LITAKESSSPAGSDLAAVQIHEKAVQQPLHKQDFIG
jgi:hypothetical protein